MLPYGVTRGHGGLLRQGAATTEPLPSQNRGEAGCACCVNDRTSTTPPPVQLDVLPMTDLPQRSARTTATGLQADMTAVTGRLIPRPICRRTVAHHPDAARDEPPSASSRTLRQRKPASRARYISVIGCSIRTPTSRHSGKALSPSWTAPTWRGKGSDSTTSSAGTAPQCVPHQNAGEKYDLADMADDDLEKRGIYAQNTAAAPGRP